MSVSEVCNDCDSPVDKDSGTCMCTGTLTDTLKNQDFSKLPVSISELKSRKSEFAKDQTPRNALIELLRKIDAGEIDPRLIVIGWAGKTNDDGTIDSGFKFAGPGNSMEYLGLASRLWHHANY